MKRLLVIGSIIMLFTVGAVAQTKTLQPVPNPQFLDSSGDPLALGHVHTFIAGTTTPQATYTDSTGNTLNANPVVLDAGGFADSGGIWLTPTQSYKFQVDDSGNVLQYTVDNVRTALLQDANGAITAGSVIFGGTGGIVAQDNTNFFWDDSNNRLGLGTATPAVDLHIVGTSFRVDGTSTLFDSTGDADFDFRIDCGSAAEQDCLIIFADRGTDTFRIGKNNTGQFLIVDVSSGVNILQHQPSGNVLIRTTVAARTFSVLDSGSNTMFDCVDVGVIGDCTVTGTLTVDGGIPSYNWLPAAGCNNVTASPFWDLFTSNTPAVACITGSQTTKGVFDFDAAADEHAQITLMLPTGFTGNIDVIIKWLAASTSGDVVWFVQTSCVADGETDDPAWNTASFVADTAKGTTLQTNDATISAITITGCAAGELFHLRWGRDGDGSLATDDMTGDARGIGVQLKILKDGS